MRPESAPKLTPRQQECLNVIRNHTAKFGLPPTIRSIADAMGIVSPNGVICHLLALQRKGYITREPGQNRAITLTARSYWSLPFEGTIE